jgi:hypothetical protein
MRSGKILVVVEGEKLDVALMKKLLAIYKIPGNHEIIPYKTSIHILCQSVLRDNKIAEIDLRLHLREHEKNPVKKAIFDQKFEEILLIFDLDPQDSFFTPETLLEITNHFSESTETGKLYINYPMVEAFYHMKQIPDPDYDTRTASLAELRAKQYKARVTLESRNGEKRRLFASSRDECNDVIRQNINKAWLITSNNQPMEGMNHRPPSQFAILSSQLDKLRLEGTCSVLCTCPFYISDYNPALIP